MAVSVGLTELGIRQSGGADPRAWFDYLFFARPLPAACTLPCLPVLLCFQYTRLPASYITHYLTAVQYIYSLSNFSSLSNLHDQGSTVGADHASRQILVLDRVEEGFGHIFDLSNLARRHFGFK